MMEEILKVGQNLRKLRIRQSNKNAEDAIGFYERMAVIVKGAKMRRNDTKYANVLVEKVMDKYAFAKVIEYVELEPEPEIVRRRR